jgi:hypothetical protein
LTQGQIADNIWGSVSDIKLSIQAITAGLHEKTLRVPVWVLTKARVPMPFTSMSLRDGPNYPSSNEWEKSQGHTLLMPADRDVNRFADTGHTSFIDSYTCPEDNREHGQQGRFIA